MREAGMIGAPKGISKVGKRRAPFLTLWLFRSKPRRASFETTFPNRSPETRDKCWAAS
jgi:hypothetical protein